MKYQHTSQTKRSKRIVQCDRSTSVSFITNTKGCLTQTDSIPYVSSLPFNAEPIYSHKMYDILKQTTRYKTLLLKKASV